MAITTKSSINVNPLARRVLRRESGRFSDTRVFMIILRFKTPYDRLHGPATCLCHGIYGRSTMNGIERSFYAISGVGEAIDDD
jgi:hypothetical protein